MYSNLDFERYSDLLKSVASFSNLYSKSKIPYLHPRFIEKLFVETCRNQVEDISRKDNSFDCLEKTNIGVGIKTFRTSSTFSHEKVAQFNKGSVSWKGSDLEDLIKKVCVARNNRITSDSIEHGVSLLNPYYHCLVRQEGEAFIHEEPLQLINLNKLSIVNKKKATHPYFNDGNSEYSFNPTNNTLLKTFDFKKHYNTEKILLPVISETKVLETVELFYQSLNKDYFNITSQGTLNFLKTSIVKEDYVILALYGQKKFLVVGEKSGINHWNANDTKRKRKFAESYIPIPKIVHKLKPNFFPPRNIKFRTKLPNNKIITTKISQDDNKAFQSDPLTDLCQWLYELIDLDIEKSKSRFQKKDVYTYEDLKKVGKDSVKIIKVKNKDYDYEMHTMPLGSFEKFKNGEESI